MKKIFLALLASSALFLQGCEGPVGPQGPPGESINIVGEVFEVDATFNAGNEFRTFYDFSKSIEISDVLLVYILEGSDNGNDIWEKIPTVRFLANGGLVQYAYDFTINDFSIFMEGNVNLNTLPSNMTQNKVFRVVVVPADFAKTVNTNDINAVMKGANISKDDIVMLGK